MLFCFDDRPLEFLSKQKHLIDFLSKLSDILDAFLRKMTRSLATPETLSSTGGVNNTPSLVLVAMNYWLGCLDNSNERKSVIKKCTLLLKKVNAILKGDVGFISRQRSSELAGLAAKPKARVESSTPRPITNYDRSSASSIHGGLNSIGSVMNNSMKQPKQSSYPAGGSNNASFNVQRILSGERDPLPSVNSATPFIPKSRNIPERSLSTGTKVQSRTMAALNMGNSAIESSYSSYEDAEQPQNDFVSFSHVRDDYLEGGEGASGSGGATGRGVKRRRGKSVRWADCATEDGQQAARPLVEVRTYIVTEEEIRQQMPEMMIASSSSKEEEEEEVGAIADGDKIARLELDLRKERSYLESHRKNRIMAAKLTWHPPLPIETNAHNGGTARPPLNSKEYRTQTLRLAKYENVMSRAGAALTLSGKQRTTPNDPEEPQVSNEEKRLLMGMNDKDVLVIPWDVGVDQHPAGGFVNERGQLGVNSYQESNDSELQKELYPQNEEVEEGNELLELLPPFVKVVLCYGYWKYTVYLKLILAISFIGA